MENLNLPKKARDAVEGFLSALKDVYRDSLVAVFLYGSAASGEFSRYSNINLAVILTDASLDNLRKISGIANKKRFEIINPIFLTEDYIKNSKDVFPIEFLDMKENHALVYGRDELKSLEVDIKNLRFQCEQELRSKLINIRRHYLKARGNACLLKRLLFKSFTSTLHILRNVIRLEGERPNYLKEDVLKNLEEKFEIDAKTFRRVLDAKNGNLRLRRKETEGLLFDFTAALDKIIDLVERF